MNIPILAIIGIAATVVLGLCGIYVAVKRKYPGEITFVQESCLGLFDSIVKNMPELAVHYKGSAVGEGLVLLKGAFLNTGSKDISEAMVEEKVSISLPEEFGWLTAKVVSTSAKVQAQLAMLDRSVVLETGLFRCREYIRFEALAEVPTKDARDNDGAESIEKKLGKALKINHRIADTQKIKKKDLAPPYSQRRFKRRLAVLSVILVMGVVLVTVICFRGLPGELRFLIPSGEGQTIEVRTLARADGTLRVKGVQDKTYRKRVPAEEFFKTPGIVPKIVTDPVFKFLMIGTVIMYIGLPLLVGAVIYRVYRRDKKLRQLLSIPE